MSASLLADTLGNPRWLMANHEALLRLFPERWMHVGDINLAVLGIQLTFLGVRWSHDKELNQILLFLERAGFTQRLGLRIRRHPNPPFLQSTKEQRQNEQASKDEHGVNARHDGGNGNGDLSVTDA